MRIKPSSEHLPEENGANPSTEINAEDGESPDPELEAVLGSRGLGSLAESPELQRVIRGAMDGTLPLDKPLEVNQPQKLSPRAIQTVLLAVGRYYTLKEIAAISGMDYVYVTKLVKHPYARRILSIAEAAGVAEMSRIDRRLKRKSPKMLKLVEEIAENEHVDPPVRLRAAFGWLDRAGHGETKKISKKSEVNHSVTVTHGRSKLIAEAIREVSEPDEDQEAEFEVIEDPETGKFDGITPKIESSPEMESSHAE